MAVKDRKAEGMITLRITEELLDRLDARCEELDTKRPQVVRQLIREWLGKTAQGKLRL